MSNFLIFKAAFNNSVTPAIGTYTANGANPLFNKNFDISQDYYLYNTAHGSAVQWFIPTAETTDFEFVADILTRDWTNRVTYFIIADSTGATRLRMWSIYDNWHFENSDSDATDGDQYIGIINPTTSGGFGVFHQFRVRVRKLTASSSSVEVYVDNTLKLTATAGAALVTCAKIGFVGGVNTFGPGYDAGVKNVYLYDLGDREVIDRGALSDAFTRFIGWAKNIFATKDNTVLRSGGNLMTGTKLGRPDDSGTFSISGGTTVGGNTGYVKCYGASASSYPGAVEIGGSNIKFIFCNNAIESWAGNQNLGSSSRQFGTAYIKALNINGTAAGNILTHNASEFVDVTTSQTVAGNKTFSGNTKFTSTPTIEKSTGDVELLIKNSTVDVTSVSADTVDDIRFTDSDDKITGSVRISYDTSNGVTATMYARSYSSDGSTSSTNGLSITSNQQAGTAEANLSANLLPNSTDTYDFGSTTKQWNNAYIKTLTINGTDVNTLLSGKANSSHTHTKSEITDFPTLATVATSGSYNDLSNKPTVPTKVSDLQNDSNFISNEDLQSHAENASHLSASDREKIDNLITNTFAQETFASIASLNSHVNNGSVHLSQSQINTWNSKANASHTHSISDITDLQSELDDIRAEITAVRETGGIRAMEDSEIGELSWN